MTTQRSETHVADVGRVDGVRALRACFKIDALASGLLGVLLAAASTLLADRLGLPVVLLVPAGLFLASFAVWVWYVAVRPTPARAGVRAVVVVNVLWVMASVVFVAAGWLSPTTLGTAFVLLQAAAVAIFAGMQYAALRRADRAVR